LESAGPVGEYNNQGRKIGPGAMRPMIETLELRTDQSAIKRFDHRAHASQAMLRSFGCCISTHGPADSNLRPRPIESSRGAIERAAQGPLSDTDAGQLSGLGR